MTGGPRLHRARRADLRQLAAVRRLRGGAPLRLLERARRSPAAPTANLLGAPLFQALPYVLTLIARRRRDRPLDPAGGRRPAVRQAVSRRRDRGDRPGRRSRVARDRRPARRRRAAARRASSCCRRSTRSSRPPFVLGLLAARARRAGRAVRCCGRVRARRCPARAGGQVRRLVRAPMLGGHRRARARRVRVCSAPRSSRDEGRRRLHSRGVFEIGNSLREARLRRGSTSPRRSRRRKIRAKYLRALEDERSSSCRRRPTSRASCARTPTTSVSTASSTSTSTTRASSAARTRARTRRSPPRRTQDTGASRRRRPDRARRHRRAHGGRDRGLEGVAARAVARRRSRAGRTPRRRRGSCRRSSS